MENLIDIIAKILAALLAIGVAWLAAHAKQFLTEKARETESAALIKLIDTFCEAAEQQFKEFDPTGVKRREYVEKLVVAAGYEITDIVDAAIEAAVYRINSEV